MEAFRNAKHTSDVLRNSPNHESHPGAREDIGGPRAPGVLYAVPRGGDARPHDGLQGRLHGPLALRLRRRREHPHEQGSAVHAGRRQPRHMRLPHEPREHRSALGSPARQGLHGPQRRRHRHVQARRREARRGRDRHCRREPLGVQKRRGSSRRSHPRSLPFVSFCELFRCLSTNYTTMIRSYHRRYFFSFGWGMDIS